MNEPNGMCADRLDLHTNQSAAPLHLQAPDGSVVTVPPVGGLCLEREMSKSELLSAYPPPPDLDAKQYIANPLYDTNGIPPDLDDQLIQILCNLKYCELCGRDEDIDGNGRSSLDVDEAFKQIKALFHAEDAPALPPETRP